VEPKYQPLKKGEPKFCSTFIKSGKGGTKSTFKKG